LFHELVGGRVDDPAEVVVGIETDRSLLVGARVAAEYQVLAINPMAASRYRDRHADRARNRIPVTPSGDL
jgi:hypothetical protein